jgi:hypothetical protein
MVVKPVELAGDVVTGASALAGLFLVYLGNVATAFSTFDKSQQTSVRGSHQTRGWLAFAGTVFAILAAGLALLGKWLGSQCIASGAIVLLLLALVWGAGLAFVASRDELWIEFARLTGWRGTVSQRPKYWGRLVMELVYEYLDADVAQWLKENAPAPRHGQNYHQ